MTGTRIDEARLPIVRLITFGAGSNGYLKSMKRLGRQAEGFPWVDEFKSYSDADLSSDFYENMGPLVASNPKGFGLWSWKPFLILHELERLNNGDVLIYLDAGVELNKRGASRFTHYLDHLARKDVLVFSLDHQHRQWTKNHELIFERNENFFRNQVVAGVLMLRVSDTSKTLIAKWKELCMLDNGALLEDPLPKDEQGHGDYLGHRHDQSLLSKVVFDHALETWPDETIFRPWRKGKDSPFLALRNKSSRWSWMWWAFITPFIVWRIVYVLSNPGLLRAKFFKWRR